MTECTQGSNVGNLESHQVIEEKSRNVDGRGRKGKEGRKEGREEEKKEGKKERRKGGRERRRKEEEGNGGHM
jgi:hypothetical protein